MTASFSAPRLPRLAVVVAVDRGDGGRSVIPVLAIGEPNRNHEATVFELNAVPRTGGDGLPIILLAEGVKRRRDVHGLAPGQAIVGAAHGEAACVIDTVEELNGSRLAIHNGDGIVYRLLVGTDVIFFVRIAFESYAMMGDVLRGLPCLPAISRAA